VTRPSGEGGAIWDKGGQRTRWRVAVGLCFLPGSRRSRVLFPRKGVIPDSAPGVRSYRFGKVSGKVVISLLSVISLRDFCTPFSASLMPVLNMSFMRSLLYYNARVPRSLKFLEETPCFAGPVVSLPLFS
jgi:hypothetical protein